LYNFKINNGIEVKTIVCEISTRQIFEKRSYKRGVYV
jgi:hypothetical protein